MRICKRFENSSLDNYEITTPEQKHLVEALKNGINNGFKKNILIVGSVGTGKTHLAFALLNTLADKVKSSQSEYRFYEESKVIYRPIKEIIDNIKTAWKDPLYSEMDKYCNVPLLIIDEVGIQYGTNSERTELYTIFNRRYEDMLPIIAISNHKQDALKNILGQRIYDRLTGEGALTFELEGKSYRQGGQHERG